MTYAVNINEYTSWPVDTLADMQARKRRFERMADAFRINGDEAHARLYEEEAAAEAERIERHKRLVAHSAARIQHDRLDVPEKQTVARVNWSAIGLACLIVAAFVFVIGDGIARAFNRPAGCEHLSAADCTAWLQEAR